ncbi:DUF590-domain-containing protein [Fistulina hepatica ATCC 64428]|uniref:DUF590-domain-containing protein n=1 Tax=Fistulina hepatica ATCC 64428 TaxID=1128425 RepID=A0A0D7A4Z5_9AGAR|nr:DUF590-domain-containing protein [Fistulina hepatica ATCC 64428]
MPGRVDLVIIFRASPSLRAATKDDARKADAQYTALLDTLTHAGLHAVARRGDTLGQLLVFVTCPPSLLDALVRRERQQDFLAGLPTSPATAFADARGLPASDRIRLVHTYVTSLPADGGLGVCPGASEWDLIESMAALHDRDYNHAWIHTWTHHHVGATQIDNTREQFGDAVALYFAFLHSYTRALIFPTVLGLFFYFFGDPYSPVYSLLLLIWSIVYTEWWSIKERLFALRFGTRGVARVEKQRPQYKASVSWWQRDFRMAASLPVILLYAVLLVGILTLNFVLEAFLVHLYEGPGNQIIAMLPTITFSVLIPQFLSFYQTTARRFTTWEDHARPSQYEASLTYKTFSLSALVAYLGLALSAFVYVPLGEQVMQLVQRTFAFHWLGASPASANGTSKWNLDAASAKTKLNGSRLRQQMFAFTVTGQVVNTFTEIGLPFILRHFNTMLPSSPISSVASDASTATATSSRRKRVVFEDEQARGGVREREFLEHVRAELALPEYDTFEDYNEMVTQYGYVVLWSAIWPLAPLMALVNNFFEMRSDAYKITVHHRRPIPVRTDTIGPWRETMDVLAWLGAMTNAALVYLFHGGGHANISTGGLWCTLTGGGEGWSVLPGAGLGMLVAALLIALCASHAYMLLRRAVGHVVEQALWRGSAELRERERQVREMKEHILRSEMRELQAVGEDVGEDPPPFEGFWDYDEGHEEIARISKEA